MTIEQCLTQYLDDRGLWPNETKAVMAEFRASDPAKPMTGRWNDQVDEYPSDLRAILAVSLNHTAVEWIDKHAPKHWARVMFTS